VDTSPALLPTTLRATLGTDRSGLAQRRLEALRAAHRPPCQAQVWPGPPRTRSVARQSPAGADRTARNHKLGRVLRRILLRLLRLLRLLLRVQKLHLLRLLLHDVGRRRLRSRRYILLIFLRSDVDSDAVGVDTAVELFRRNSSTERDGCKHLGSFLQRHARRD